MLAPLRIGRVAGGATRVLRSLRHRLARGSALAVLAIGGAAITLFMLSPRERVFVNAPFSPRPVRTHLSAKSIEDAAARIDALVMSRRGSVPTPPPAPDEVFLRRVYLDITGRIPTVEAARTFLDSDDPRKRGQLIDQLLASEGYVHGLFHFWADLLRYESTTAAHWVGVEMGEWIKNSLRDNKPYDQFVYELLTAQGLAYKGNPVGYRVRDQEMVVDHTVHTVRAFLGVEIRCAQCHDHPTEAISQRDFYQLQAFFANTTVTTVDLQERNASRFWRTLNRTLWPPSTTARERTAAFYIPQKRTFDYRVHPDGPLRLPEDYAYDDAIPGSVVAPSVAVLGGTIEPVDDRSDREAFARWLVAPQNERFVMTIVHRLWAHVMGEALVDDLSTLDAAESCSHPQLTRHLQQLLVELDFNMQEFLRVLYRTELYQTDTAPGDSRQAPVAGRGLRRMSAEQLWDSLVGLVVEDLDERKGYGSLVVQSRGALDKLRAMSPVEFRRWQNLPFKESSTHPSNGEADVSQIRLLRGKGNTWTWDRTGTSDPRWDRLPRRWVRASELQSPAIPGHFLAAFGQPGRSMTIDRPLNEPSLQQVFHLINGPVHKHLWNPQSILRQQLAGVEDPADKVDILYLAILSRRPEAAELARCLDEFREAPSSAERRVAWALINSLEFLFSR